MKCVGSQRVTGDNFNRMNTIPSDSSIPGEKLFLGDALQGSRHSGKKYHTVGRKGGGAHLTLYDPAAGGESAETLNPARWLENSSNFVGVITASDTSESSRTDLERAMTSLTPSDVVVRSHFFMK